MILIHLRQISENLLFDIHNNIRVIPQRIKPFHQIAAVAIRRMRFNFMEYAQNMFRRRFLLAAYAPKPHE